MTLQEVEKKLLGRINDIIDTCKRRDKNLINKIKTEFARNIVPLLEEELETSFSFDKSKMEDVKKEIELELGKVRQEQIAQDQMKINFNGHNGARTKVTKSNQDYYHVQIKQDEEESIQPGATDDLVLAIVYKYINDLTRGQRIILYYLVDKAIETASRDLPAIYIADIINETKMDRANLYRYFKELHSRQIRVITTVDEKRGKNAWKKLQLDNVVFQYRNEIKNYMNSCISTNFQEMAAMI